MFFHDSANNQTHIASHNIHKVKESILAHCCVLQNFPNCIDQNGITQLAAVAAVTNPNQFTQQIATECRCDCILYILTHQPRRCTANLTRKSRKKIGALPSDWFMISIVQYKMCASAICIYCHAPAMLVAWNNCRCVRVYWSDTHQNATVALLHQHHHTNAWVSSVCATIAE